MSLPSVNQFCKQVGAKLQCSHATKKALLDGLLNELQELPSTDTISVASIEARIGTVGQVAAELQSTISPDEIQRATKRKQKRWYFLIGFLFILALLLLLFSYFIFTNGPFYIVETIEEY